MRYKFDNKTQRYRQMNPDGSLGSFVSRAAILRLTERNLESYKPELKAISQDLIDGKIGLALWEQKIAAKIKTGHIQSWALGRGGIDRLTNRDYGLMGTRIKDQYTYLRNFAQAIRRGELSEAQILARVELYAEAFYPTQQAAVTEGHRLNGDLWYQNRLAAGENCPGCIAETGKGWQAIGMGIPIGARNCLVRCRCHWEYSNTSDKPTQSILRPCLSSLLQDSQALVQIN